MMPTSIRRLPTSRVDKELYCGIDSTFTTPDANERKNIGTSDASKTVEEKEIQ